MNKQLKGLFYNEQTDQDGRYSNLLRFYKNGEVVYASVDLPIAKTPTDKVVLWINTDLEKTPKGKYEVHQDTITLKWDKDVTSPFAGSARLINENLLAVCRPARCCPVVSRVNNRGHIEEQYYNKLVPNEYNALEGKPSLLFLFPDAYRTAC